MAQVSPEELDAAREAGRLVGTDPGSFGGNCPYRYPHQELLLAWHDGFGEGRATLAPDPTLPGIPPKRRVSDGTFVLD